MIDVNGERTMYLFVMHDKTDTCAIYCDVTYSFLLLLSCICVERMLLKAFTSIPIKNSSFRPCLKIIFPILCMKVTYIYATILYLPGAIKQPNYFSL